MTGQHISTGDKGLDLAFEGKPCDGLRIQVSKMSCSEHFSFYEVAALRTVSKCSIESIKLTFSAKEDKLEVSNDL